MNDNKFELTSKLSKSKMLQFMSLNCRSVKEKMPELKLFLDEFGVNVALLQETWLSEGDSSVYAQFKEMGFKVLKLERKMRRGGGLAILYKSVTLKRLPVCKSSKYKQFEFLSCCLFSSPRKSKVNVVNIYRPPNLSKKEFLIYLNKVITRPKNILHEKNT